MAKTATRSKPATAKKTEATGSATPEGATEIRMIPLDELEPSPLNVCKVAASASDDAKLGPDAQLELARRVAAFDGFKADCDPQGWHEMGVVDLSGTTAWFKLDLYDIDWQCGT